MHPLRTSALSLLAAATLAACSSLPTPNAMLDQAHKDYQQAQDTPQTAELAAVQLKQASDSLAQADEAARAHAAPAQIDHLAYLAQQRVAIAQSSAQQKRAEAAVREGEANRDQARLVARTREADSAQRSAVSAQRQAEASQRDAAASQGRSEAALLQAQAATQQADVAQARNSELEAKLKELDARKTDRGLVITLGDVLFDTNRAELKSGGQRSVEKLAAFLQQYPQRKALVEGYTDSVGGQDMNEALSQRRADAVRSALLGQGVAADRISTHGYGEAHPVAGNDSAAGRQQNRRVEIVLSDEQGLISAR